MSVEVFPVVHINESAQAAEQASLAFELGADGVYLIDHNNRKDTAKLLDTFRAVSTDHPDQFVGLNFLQFSAAWEGFALVLEQRKRGSIPRLPDGIWVDDADREKETLKLWRSEHAELKNICYLGGVAFKYTDFYTDDPGEAAAEAVRLEPYIDVVTTSGRGTGHAPSPEKIAAMKSAVKGKLAVASGISIENLENYNGSIDQVLISTSVEVEPYSGIFMPSRLRDFIELAHSI